MSAYYLLPGSFDANPVDISVMIKDIPMDISKPFTFPSITLKTPRLTLREFAEGDAEAIQVYAGDLEVTRFTSWGPNTPETTDAVLSGWLQEQKTSPRTEYTLAIVRQEDGVLIGGAGFGMTDWNRGTANFGYVLRRSAWGQGYATEAGRALSDWALGELGLRRLVAHCEPDNIGSKHVLEKIGFELEERLVSLPRIDGEIRSYLAFLKERP
jgi:RimJ/RimL family protein N-acetyltransferase